MLDCVLFSNWGGRKLKTNGPVEGGPGASVQTKKETSEKYEKCKRSRWGSNPGPYRGMSYARLLPLG